MHANSKSFLMAIVVGTTTLVLAQIYAPNHLKPLTNRLITYPGSIPALNLKNGIFQTTFTSSKLISELPLRAKNTISSFLPQVGTIAMIREDQVGTGGKVVKPSTKPATVTPKPVPKDERDDIKPSTKPSTKPPSPTPLAPYGYGNNQPSPITSPSKAPSPSPIKSPTPSKAPTASIKPSSAPTAQDVLDQARQDAYTSTYGTETGRYGYNYTTGKPATTAEWNDPKAVIAGTYVAPNGKRYSVNIDTTNKAGDDLMNKVSSSIVNLSDQEILDLAKSRNQTNPCGASDKACQQKIIQATLAQIAKESFIGNVSPDKISAITDAQHKNSVFQTQINNFMDPSKSLNDLAGCTAHPGECRGLTLEDYLRDIGVDPKDIPGLLKSRENAAKFQTQIKNFMDPSKSLNDLAGCTAHPGECRGLTAEQYLHDIGVDPKDIPALLEGRQANLTAVAKAKQVQQTQINTVNKFLTKSNADLVNEYCKGVSADRCDDLINGGILTSVGISPEDAKKFVTQKQAAITISQYETGNLSIVAGKPVDYQAAYKAAYVTCMSQSRGRDQNCETKAASEADKKVAKLTTPVDYQAKYDQGYNTCLTNSQGRGAYSYGDCNKYATNFAQTAVTNSTTGAINVPKVEVANLTASCIALGGKNCASGDAAITSLAALTGNPELTLATIQSQKLQIQQEQKAYSNVANTLTNLGKYDQVSAAVASGQTTWIDVQNNISNLREDGWTNAVIGWNDFTAGRFKRGNDLLMEGEREGDVAKILKGSLIQGGDAAMVITAAAAIPLAPALGLGAGAFFGTGVGVAASTQMIGSAADTCELANQGKATKADCNKALAMASISVVGTGLGVVGEATKLVQAGQEVTQFTRLTNAVGTISQGATASKIISGVEVINDVVSAGTFTAMAKDTCDAAGPESLDCISSVAMAIASGGKLVTNGVNVVTRAANVEQSMGGVSQFSSAALQGAHTASADLFFLSACSKMLDPEIAKTSDSVAMCAFGLSGAVQTHVIANLSPAGKPPELSTEKTPVSDVTLTPKDLAEYNTSKNKLTEAQAAVEKLAKTVDLTSGSVQKDVLVQLNEAKAHLSTMEQAHSEVIAKITAESVAATAALTKAKAEVDAWQKTVDNLSGQTQKDAQVQLNDAKIALSLAETANKIAMAKAATVNPQAPVPAAPPVAPPPPNNQGDGAKPQGLIAKVGEYLFGKESAPIQVADRKIVLNEEFKGLVEKLGEIKANRGESALSGKDPVLVAETRTVEGKEVTQFKFNEKVTERSGMTEAELGKLNQVFSDFQAFSDKNIGFDAAKGIRGQQADYLMAGLEAFAQHGSTGSLFGALPGLGKTEVILPMMTYLHASMTNDPQFVLFPEVKLMRPWLSIDANGKAVKNAEIISFFEQKFGEGSVLILEPGQVPTAAEVGKARVVVATRDAAFELQSIDTLGGRALREKWASSYKFVDESHWTTNLFENFRRSGASNKISEIAEAKVFESALESVRKFTSVNELVEARKSGTPLDVKLTSDGKTGEYTVEREVKIITELLEKNKSILPDNLKNLEINERNLAESKKLIDQFVDQNFSQPKVKNFAAELTTINKLADLLAAVPGTHYGLSQKGGEYSISPREQSRPTGRAYSNLAEQIIYNKVGVEILKGVGEMKSSINVNVDNLTVSTGGTETTYARLMLEGKGFAMFTGTPELMAKLYKIAYGIELKVFSASAFETVSTRFAAGDNNGIFTSIKEQVKSRIKEFNQGKSQVYTLMDGKTSNVEMTDRLLSNYKEGDKVFIVKATGELVEGKVTGGKFELVKTLDSAEALGRSQEAAGKYVKIYEFGAHTGVDTPNNVDLSRAIGICNGCDQTTFSQGINRVRLDANGNAAPMDIIVLDQALRSTPKDQLFSEFSKLTAENEAHNLTVAEVNFKEILLKTSVEITFERLLAKSGDGVIGAIRDGGLKAKLEAIQSSWKSISEYNYKLDNTNFTPEQKLARTLEQVQGVMKSVDAAIGNNRSVRAEFESSVGKYSELSIKFNETESFRPLGDKPSLGDVVELINNTSADLKTTTVTFREKGASGETIAVAGQEAVRNVEANQPPTLLQRTQNLIKSVTTPVIVPRSLALLTVSKTFKSFSTEDEDGNILRIFKDSTGKLILEESNQDVGMSSSREFNMTDLDLFPPASQTVATRYNDKLIPNSDYSRNAIKPGRDNAEEIQKIIDSEEFNKMSIALANGDTITIEIIGGDPVVNTKTADGKAYSESPTTEQLSEILADLADQIVAISSNGEDVPLMTYLTLPNEKLPLLETLSNFFGSANSEKAGGITFDSSKINPPSAASFRALGSAIANALRDLSENYLLAQVQPIEQKPATPEENKPEDLTPNVVETKVVETKTKVEEIKLTEQDNLNIIYILPSQVNTKIYSNLKLVVDATNGLAKAKAVLKNVDDFPIILNINGQEVTVQPYNDVDLKIGDQVAYGYQTIKLLGIDSKKKNPKINLEITTISQPFDPKKELSNLSKTPIKSEERKSRLTTYKTQLADRYGKLQLLYNNIVEIVSQKDSSEATIQKKVLDGAISMNLTDVEIGRIQSAVHDYLAKIEKVKALIIQYPTPEQLFEAAFGAKPTGAIKLQVRNATLDFITTNDIDFAIAYYRNTVVAGKVSDITETQLSKAKRYAGFSITSSTLIPDTESVFTVNRQKSASSTEKTLVHEREHAFYSVLAEALSIGENSKVDNSEINKTKKELMLLTSGDPDLVKKSTLYQAQFPLKTYNPKSDIDDAKKLDAITQATRKFALLMRKEAENDVANELVARLTEKTYKSWNIKFRVSRAAFRADILSYITETNDYQHDDLTYNYFDKYRNNNFDLTSFNNNWTKSTDTPESRAIKSELDRVYSAQEQSDVAQRAIDAYIALILKGYTNEEAVALLSTNKLSTWGATARRLPLAQKDQIIPENSLTKSGSSLGNRIKDFFKNIIKSPNSTKLNIEKFKPDSDVAIEIKDSDSKLVKDVKTVAQKENIKLFEIPSAQLSDRIDLDETGEAKGSRSSVFKTKITLGGVEKEVAVKVYLSDIYTPDQVLEILTNETKNNKLATTIFGNQASELFGVVVTDDGKVGLITELVETADDNFTPTEKTASDLMSIQQKMINAGYYIQDFAINYLIQKDGSVKLIDFEQLVKISSLLEDKINLKKVAKDVGVTQEEVKADPVKYILLSSLRIAVMSPNIAAQNITYENGLILPSNSVDKMYDLPKDINFLEELFFFTDINRRPPQYLDNYVVLNQYVDSTFKAEPKAKTVIIGYTDKEGNYKTHSISRPKLSQVEVKQEKSRPATNANSEETAPQTVTSKPNAIVAALKGLGDRLSSLIPGRNTAADKLPAGVLKFAKDDNTDSSKYSILATTTNAVGQNEYLLSGVNHDGREFVIKISEEGTRLTGKRFTNDVAIDSPVVNRFAYDAEIDPKNIEIIQTDANPLGYEIRIKNEDGAYETASKMYPGTLNLTSYELAGIIQKEDFESLEVKSKDGSSYSIARPKNSESTTYTHRDGAGNTISTHPYTPTDLAELPSGTQESVHYNGRELARSALARTNDVVTLQIPPEESINISELLSQSSFQILSFANSTGTVTTFTPTGIPGQLTMSTQNGDAPAIISQIPLSQIDLHLPQTAGITSVTYNDRSLRHFAYNSPEINVNTRGQSTFGSNDDVYSLAKQATDFVQLQKLPGETNLQFKERVNKKYSDSKTLKADQVEGQNKLVVLINDISTVLRIKVIIPIASFFSRTEVNQTPAVIVHDSTAYKNKEQDYLTQKLPKMPGLDTRYEHESTGDVGYLQDMDRYIGVTALKPAPRGNISKSGINVIRKNVKAEINRLFNSSSKRISPLKLTIITWQTNRYLDLLQQAIDEGDIKTTGDTLTLADVQYIVARNIHTLAFQDYVATENSLGDHGLRHLVEHNIKIAEEVLNQAKKFMSSRYKLRAMDYLITHQIMIDHDTGYATDIVRAGVNADATKGTDSGHNVLAAKMIRERTQGGTDPLSRLFGAEGIARIHQGVLTHDSSKVDIGVDAATTVDSAIHLADNTHAFESKLPEILYGYPESFIAMRLLKAAGEMGNTDLVTKIRQQLVQSIRDNPKIGKDDKVSLSVAANTLTPKSYAFTVGRIMGKDPVVTFDEATGKIVVSVTENNIHQDVVRLFDKGAYDQLAKFIADLLGVKKDEAMARINTFDPEGNSDLKFEGSNVIIQAIIGENQKAKDQSPFQSELDMITRQDADFTNYLVQDQSKHLVITNLMADIKNKLNGTTSLHTILALNEFNNVTITLQSGEIRTFTNVDGQIAYTSYTDENSGPGESQFINPTELEGFLPKTGEIARVFKDGVALEENSYTTLTEGALMVHINELQDQLANYIESRVKLINDYLNR